MGYLLSMFAGLLIGGVLVWAYMRDIYQYAVAYALEREDNAHKLNGRLSKRIHKQRLIIKTLKANQIPKPKSAYTPQPTVSH